jgi:capsular polysaccharide biosynthesis protein
MPDLFTVLEKRWKFILGLTMLAAIIAFVVTILSPKEYLATATALPANSLVADKARVFNQNIEALYSDFGTPDELDKLEGTSKLDTIFIAAARQHDLASHYGIDNSGESDFKAAMDLKKNSRINRSGYGELKVKVWDKDRNKAAELANTLMQNIQDLHRHLQNESNIALLGTLRNDQQVKLEQYRQLSDSSGNVSGADAEIFAARKEVLLEQLQQYERMIAQYQLAVNSNPQVLLPVENARPPLWPDKPKTLLTVLLAAFAAFAIAYLMALLVESRRSR